MSQASLQPSSEAPISNDWALGFTHRLTRQAFQYWNELRAGRDMPTAQDLSVRGMKSFIGNVGLIEVMPLAAGGWDFRIRVAGENTKRIVGDVAGKRFCEFLAPEGERRWRFGAEAVCARRAPVRNFGSLTFAQLEWLDFETVLAPLGEEGEITDLFVAFVTWTRKV